MTTITITPELLKQLNGLTGPLEFRDAQGRLLGAFQPSGNQLTYAQLVATCPISEVELQRLARESLAGMHGRSLSEILADLEHKWPTT